MEPWSSIGDMLVSDFVVSLNVATRSYWPRLRSVIVWDFQVAWRSVTKSFDKMSINLTFCVIVSACSVQGRTKCRMCCSR